MLSLQGDMTEKYIPALKQIAPDSGAYLNEVSPSFSFSLSNVSLFSLTRLWGFIGRFPGTGMAEGVLWRQFREA